MALYPSAASSPITLDFPVPAMPVCRTRFTAGLRSRRHRLLRGERQARCLLRSHGAIAVGAFGSAGSGPATCYSTAHALSSATLPGLVQVVAPQAVTGVDIKLAAGGSISGIVTGNPGLPGVQNQACVVAVPTNPEGSNLLVWTDASGRYVMPGLAAGTYDQRDQRDVAALRRHRRNSDDRGSRRRRRRMRHRRPVPRHGRSGVRPGPATRHRHHQSYRALPAARPDSRAIQDRIQYRLRRCWLRIAMVGQQHISDVSRRGHSRIGHHHRDQRDLGP